jgi:hypothetical protein
LFWLIIISILNPLFLVFFTPSNSFCNISRCPFCVAKCQALFPSLSFSDSNLPVKSSAVSLSLPHSHSFSNNFMSPFLAAKCQAVRCFSSLANNNLLHNSSAVRFFSPHSHIFCKHFRSPCSATKCQAIFLPVFF